MKLIVNFIIVRKPTTKLWTILKALLKSRKAYFGYLVHFQLILNGNMEEDTGVISLVNVTNVLKLKSFFQLKTLPAQAKLTVCWQYNLFKTWTVANHLTAVKIICRRHHFLWRPLNDIKMITARQRINKVIISSLNEYLFV